ncbi:HAD family hydrolase [Zavarzinella formosa]|uniref:HAD family hydrolase n=1 Tax=Zavarzinella formosa TaxID=360055 RepID=UPI00037797C7|nr:HAD family hydrolase [Zavarzinella formosa]
MIASHIRAVFFDAVGTVLFPYPGVSATYARLANQHGAALTEETVRARLMPAFIKQEKIDGQNGWTTSEEREALRWRDIMAEVMPEADLEACFRDLWAHYTTPAAWSVPGEVGPALANLKGRGLTLGLASNFDARLKPLAAGFLELEPVWNRLVISSLVGHRKPGRPFFEEVIRQAGCAPAEILYVGDDRRNDYDGAMAAGLEAVLFAPEGAEPGIRTVRSLAELAH